jgi:CheY-like chemotaxis protein
VRIVDLLPQASDAPILIAENDPNDLMLLQSRLRHGAVTNPIVSVRNGAELMAILKKPMQVFGGERRFRPRLLLLDLNMPEATGFEALRWIRLQPEWKDLPVVILTGVVHSRDVTFAAELGVVRFLTKYPPAAVFAEIVGGICLVNRPATPAAA